MDGFKKLKITPIRGLIIGLGILSLTSLVPYRAQVNNYASLAGVQDGANICFSRVVQSFTAKMLGDASSGYLTKEFLSMTEECYADMIRNSESAFRASYRSIGSDINTLASEVHWFNEKLNVAVIDLTGNTTSPQLVQSRFRKLEELNDSIGMSIEKTKNQVKDSFSYWAIACVAFLMSMIGLIIVDFRRTAKKIARQEDIEKLAATEMNTGDVITSNRAETIIRDALENYDMVKCAELFSKYHGDILEGKVSAYVRSSVNVDTRADKKEQMGLSGNKFQLVTVIDQVVNRLKDQIYAHGVFVDIDVDDELLIKAEAEEVVQVLYEAIGHSLKRAIKSEEHPRLNITAKPLGGTIICHIDANGGTYAEDTVRAMKKSDAPPTVGTSLLILKELAKEISGRVQLENLKAGSRIKVVMKRARSLDAVEDKTVTRVVKGSKKEVLSQLKEA